ncbi:MAG: FAD-dependent oxidoreductase [Rhodovulum sulfidophilum]|uniref:FAD-dependent oxidoreductase n=1 Tax=Rhodovulum sulfidophilum TaxID=35806 RepID=A0A2W5N5G5_RHOSU|nr:MAG: FAD-dependent oxidoreductase [Rhodovulum sulfidophilum]
MPLAPLSHGLWALTAPPAPATPPLAGPAETAVAIIGAGYTGLSAALHLAEAGIAATVLEAEEVGFGGAGRNVGLVNAGMWVRPDDLAATLGADHGARLICFLGGAPRAVFALVDRHGIACEARPAGTLHCAAGAAGRAEIETRAQQWQARGAPVELLSAAETRARIGGGAYAGALLDHRAGTIQPLAFARGLAAAAMRAGAAVHTGSPVTAAVRDGRNSDGGDWRLATPGGVLRAKWVIVATDAYTREVWPALRRGQVHLPYFNLATEPAPESAGILPGGEGCWDTRQVLTSIRTDAAGRLILGSVGRLGAVDRPIHEAWARRTLARLFPALGEVAFESAWFGQIGMTATHLPAFHQLDARVVAVAGYNGRGIAPGVAFGRALAEHAMGERPAEAMPLPVSPAGSARFRAAREAWIRFGAGLVHALAGR